MILKMYSIYDKKVGFLVPSFQQNDLVAKRNFEIDMSSSDAVALNLHPEDFNLQLIGEYDTDTGIVKSLPIEVVCDAGEFVRKGV